MIIEFFLQLVVWLGDFVIGLMPPDDSAGVVGSASSALAGLVSMGSGLSAWIPWPVVGAVGALTFGAWTTLFVVKIIRQLLAHVPQFGGTG